MANNRVFFLPPPPYPGFGRPRVRGRKIKLNDARTLPQRDTKEEWELENGGRIEVSHWDDVLTCGQFNSAEAEGRVQVWVEMAATAFWFFWALQALAETGREKLPGWWRRGKLTPGAVRRLAAGPLLSLGWSKPQPKPRGKSSGRVVGTRFEPRKRFKAYRSVSR